MADIITLEVYSVGPGAKVRYSNDDWANVTELASKNYYPLELKTKPKRPKQSVQLAVEHNSGAGDAILRLFATRGRTKGGFAKKRSDVQSNFWGKKQFSQRMIGRIIIEKGKIVFSSPDPKDATKFIKRTRFMESLTERKKQPNSHKPDSGDSRTFKVQKTKSSLEKISTKTFKAESGLLISHGKLHIALSPSVKG